MATMDFDGKMQVKYKLEICFQAICDACEKLSGFSVDKKDSVSNTLHLKGDMSLFSFGEIVTVNVCLSNNGYSEITVTSTPKVGGSANAPGLYGDMGKNKKNIIKIQQAISDELAKYEQDAEIPVNSVSNTTPSAADEIVKFKKLLDDGILTQEEFDAKKKQLLAI